MYWTSALVGKAVALELVPPQSLKRIAQRVRRRAGDQPGSDLHWADELVRARLLSRYQAQTLLKCTQAGDAPVDDPGLAGDSPLKVGPYIIYERVGRDDLGDTFRGRRTPDRSQSAIKWIGSQWIGGEAERLRLAAELDRWAKCGDSRVVATTLIELPQGDVALASPWINGDSLERCLQLGRRPAPAIAISLVHELISVLATADAQGLLHGDLRPSNLIVDSRGRIRLIGCGLRLAIPAAGLLAARNLPPERYDYVAPEVAGGSAPPDAASDIYSIGCILFHLLTGRTPYFGGSAERKCAQHRAGRLPDPSWLGVRVTPEIRRLLDATLQADRARRASSYNDLLDRLAEGPLKRPSVVRAQSQRRVWPSRLRSAAPGAAANGGLRRWSRWLVWIATSAATAFAAMHGSARLLPLLSLRPATRSTAQAMADGRRANNPEPSRSPGTVSSVWTATEDLRAAFRDAVAHDTITLQSPGPFLLDAVEINKPITLRGAQNLRPLFLGGPESTLRISASGVRLENIHFIRVANLPEGQNGTEIHPMIDATGQQIELADCSFQDVGGQTATAIAWRPTGDPSASPPSILLNRTLFRGLNSAIVIATRGSAEIELQGCIHLGPGPLIQSKSSPGQPLDALDMTLSHVTVYGAPVIEHSFPHPLDNATPLRVSAQNCLLIPRDRDQPLLEVRYPIQPALLLPRVSWSGSNTLCPANATVLQVKHGTESSVWNASDTAAWQKYWGTHATGVIGARLEFAGSSPRALSDIPAPRTADRAALGADVTQMRYPLPVAIEQLPVLVERLRLAQ